MVVAREAETGGLSVAVALLLLLVVVYFILSSILALVFQPSRRKKAGSDGGNNGWNGMRAAAIALTAIAWRQRWFELLKDAFNEVVVPVLVKIFGVGGQGFLHLGSLYFVKYDKLAFDEILWRIAAGGYAWILALIGILPIVLLLGSYLSTMDDVLRRKRRRKIGRQSPGFLELSDAFRKESDSSNSSFREETRVSEEKHLLKSFHMKNFLVLSELGNGTSASVVLARVSQERLQNDQFDIFEEELDDFSTNPSVNSSFGDSFPPNFREHHSPDLNSLRKRVDDMWISRIGEETNMKRAALSMPLGLNEMGQGKLSQDWSSIKWIDKQDQLLSPRSKKEFDFSAEGLELGLTNGGLPNPKHLSSARMTPEDDDTNNYLLSLGEIPDLVAVKIMEKRRIAARGMKKYIENERRVLACTKSPFILNMFGAFQDDRWAYLVLEPVPAGDLSSLLVQRSVMFEDEAKFYVGCVILALEHLHDKGITCLDVKPENMLLDQWGYLKLCDFGVAVFSGSEDRRWEMAGTTEYMSPEVINTEQVECGAFGVAGPDLWALGVLLYELLQGETPFVDDSQHDQDDDVILESIRSYVNECKTSKKGVEFESSVQQSWFVEFLSKGEFARDLSFRLLRPDPRKRLGEIESEESPGEACRAIMGHPWFSSCDWDWDQLCERNVLPPFMPDPDSLSPPFRENVSSSKLDVVNQQPMSLAQFQSAAATTASSSYSSLQEPKFEGFIPTHR